MALAAPLRVSDRDRARLREVAATRGPGSPQGLRAAIVLMAADGSPNSSIARSLAVSRPTVIHWRKRYESHGLAGLLDRQRSGRPRTISDALVIAASFTVPPARASVEQWSTRTLSAELGLSRNSVAEVWRRWGLQPARTRTLALPIVPALSLWSHEAVGLHLHPPEAAVILADTGRPKPPSFDELAGTGFSPDQTTTYRGDAMAAAIRVSAIRPAEMCPMPQHHESLIGLLSRAENIRPRRRLRLLLRNHTSLQHPEMRAWLAARPWITAHQPTRHARWLSVLELVLFAAMVEAGVANPLHEVAAIIDAVTAFERGWGAVSGPFSWTDTIVSPFAPSARSPAAT